MLQKKICLLGSFSVGKTSLISRYVNSLFSEKYLTTVGVKIDKKQLEVGGQKLTLMIWDLAGQDDFTTIRSAYLRGMAGYIVAIDGTRQHSFDVAISLHNMVRDIMGELPVAFAINKADLKEQWQLDNKHIQILAQNGHPVIETSAKLDQGINEIFNALAKQLVVQHG